MEQGNFTNGNDSGNAAVYSSDGEAGNVDIEAKSEAPNDGPMIDDHESYPESGGDAPSLSLGASSMGEPGRYTAMAHDAVDRIADMCSQAADLSKQATEGYKTMLREKPVMALGAALAFGLLVGRLAAR